MSICWVTFFGLNMLTNNRNFNHSVGVSESIQDSARKQVSGLILKLQRRLRRDVSENSKNYKRVLYLLSPKVCCVLAHYMPRKSHGSYVYIRLILLILIIYQVFVSGLLSRLACDF